ncbi:16S rRNA (uracil(1498)-N(3))-methyltransferase [Verminephrobacter aporrectodeae subsp. tuberculatae]|uniref:16S rRNA (uracil(1498)-N(3))-methyltransferase n=1 Tax=Verminephrobacter aporrectodeae TaxID=1110389 RepID=UPI0022376D5B|nr:16S rRNA (uracil(1498)-N(3))-methyltransferase [Verminephrobacter aporrectodeae]MCW5257848.1 16S rRNA (uracil(1498)-N(3))-methyltransferase [Verminephrobacter aporrectodeae subsp. tuberculatae]
MAGCEPRGPRKPPRLHCPAPLAEGAELDLPPGAARHAQVLRLQPGDGVTLFHGAPGAGDPGGEFDASVLSMGRSAVRVRVCAHHAIEREAPRAVHLLAGIIANDRMDWLVEKATELGVAGITPLAAERSVLRLDGARAARKIAHWQAVAVAACEQCGRNRVPVVHDALDLARWLHARTLCPGAAPTAQRLLLSPHPGAAPLRAAAAAGATDAADGARRPVLLLSGPEGGLSRAEEALALQHGFVATTLGPRVLRAETAPLAALAALTLP